MRVSIHSPHLTTPPSGGEAWPRTTRRPTPTPRRESVLRANEVKQRVPARTPNGLKGSSLRGLLRLRAHRDLAMKRFQIEDRAGAAYVEEILARPAVARSPSLAAGQMRELVLGGRAGAQPHAPHRGRGSRP